MEKVSNRFNFLQEQNYNNVNKLSDTPKVIKEYVLSRRSLLRMNTMPDYLVKRCSFLSGLNLLVGDKISFSLYKDKVQVSVETTGAPFWGNCRKVEDEFDIVDLTDYFEVFDEIESLNIDRVEVYKSQYNYSGNKLYVCNRKRILVIGEEVMYSRQDLMEEWAGFRCVLDMVRKSRVPYSLSSFIVNALSESVNDILSEEVDLNSDEVTLYARCDGNVVSADITSGVLRESISIDLGKDYKASRGWLTLIENIDFLLVRGVVLSVSIGGGTWSRNNCLIYSNALRKPETLYVFIRG